MRARTVLWTGTVLLAAACGGTSENGGQMDPPAPAVEGPDQAAREGRVVVTGVEGMVQVQLRTANGGLTLSGGLVPELQNLGGATVAVEGSGSDMDFVVSRYSVLEVNGARPWVGVVLRSGDGYRLDGPEGLGLTGQSDILGTLVGSKVWVTGELDGSTIRLGSYGVIRPSSR